MGAQVPFICLLYTPRSLWCLFMPQCSPAVRFIEGITRWPPIYLVHSPYMKQLLSLHLTGFKLYYN